MVAVLSGTAHLIHAATQPELAEVISSGVQCPTSRPTARAGWGADGELQFESSLGDIKGGDSLAIEQAANITHVQRSVKEDIWPRVEAEGRKVLQVCFFFFVVFINSIYLVLKHYEYEWIPGDSVSHLSISSWIVMINKSFVTCNCFSLWPSSK